MILLSRCLILISCLLAFQPLFAQNDTIDPVSDLKPPKNRELFHDYVDKQQKEILRSDGKTDNEFTPSDDAQINYYLTKAVTNKTDWVQYHIEKDTALSSQTKIKYLRGLENLLKYFNNNWRRNAVSPSHLPTIIETYEKCMQRDVAGIAIDD